LSKSKLQTHSYFSYANTRNRTSYHLLKWLKSHTIWISLLLVFFNFFLTQHWRTISRCQKSTISRFRLIIELVMWYVWTLNLRIELNFTFNKYSFGYFSKILIFNIFFIHLRLIFYDVIIVKKNDKDEKWPLM
jgi:hypothetical protein